MRDKKSILGLILLIALLVTALFILFLKDDKATQVLQAPAQNSDGMGSATIQSRVELKTDVVVDDLTKPWEIAFLPNGDMLFTERGGELTLFSSREKIRIDGLPEINVGGEGGLLGLAVDPEFEENKYLYACYNSADDIRVSRWILEENNLTDQRDIVTGMPINTTTFPNRHSGCRIMFSPEDILWIGTGDVAIASHPQDPQSLGGKILRVDRDGNPAKGNLEGPFDERVYSYGHRNVQGLTFTKEGESFTGFSVEHGPRVDDEVNLLVPGNFGWDPAPPYDENVPMTDLESFSGAIESVWSSGDPTLAPSGATLIYGEEWGEFSGNLFVAMQKTMHIRMFDVAQDGSLQDETELFKNEFGRIRTVVQAPNGNVYFATDNGSGNDKIVQIIPD